MSLFRAMSPNLEDGSLVVFHDKRLENCAFYMTPRESFGLNNFYHVRNCTNGDLPKEFWKISNNQVYLIKQGNPSCQTGGAIATLVDTQEGWNLRRSAVVVDELDIGLNR